MTDRELLQQALDALNKFDSGKRNHGMLWQVPVIEAIKARLTQPKKEWVGLTDEEYEAMAEDHVTDCYFDTLTYAKAIEAQLKEKNT